MPDADPQDKVILIIDDDESLLEFLGFTLRREGFVVETAADGREGLRKIEQLMPDAVILDLMFPDCIGYNLLKTLQIGQASSVPIIVMTASKDKRMEVMVRTEPNVVGYLEKPVKPAILLPLLRRTLHTGRISAPRTAGREHHLAHGT